MKPQKILILTLLALVSCTSRPQQEEKSTKLYTDRPPVEERAFVSPAVDAATEAIAAQITHPKLQEMFRKCFPNTLDTTVHYAEDGESRTYEGRYDLGDNDGGMIAHIRAFADSKRQPGHFHDEESAASIDTFADMLEAYTDGGRIVSVYVPEYVKQAAQRVKEKKQEEARAAWDDVLDAV
jgi:hypothetical protein